jgi:hypothetical protein
VRQNGPKGEGGARAGHAGLVVRAGVIETLVAAALIAVAVWLWLGSYEFEEAGRGLMGPAAFPRGVALLLGIASFALGVKGVAQIGQPAAASAPVVVQRPSAVLVAAVLIVLYPLLLPHFGFYPTTAVWLAALLWCAGQRNVLWGLVTVLAFLLVVKFAFQMAMGIPLP